MPSGRTSGQAHKDRLQLVGGGVSDQDCIGFELSSGALEAFIASVASLLE